MARRSSPDGYILGLDVGEKRIGVAIASPIARLPRPIDTITTDNGTFDVIRRLISEEDVAKVVVGIPRNMSGEETAQSRWIRDFAATLEKTIDVPVIFVDESLSSRRADEAASGFSGKEFALASRDSLAACFILEEFFSIIERSKGAE